MDYPQIEKYRTDIRELIGDYELEAAFAKLATFIHKVNLPELDADLLLLQSRHRAYEKRFLQIGKSAQDKEEQNEILLSLIGLLNTTVAHAKKQSDQPNPAAQREQELEAQIQALKNRINGLVQTRLEDLIVPENYALEISEELNFSFCYPKTWAFERFPQLVHYGAIIENSNNAFSSNMNVIIEDIKVVNFDLETIYAMGVQSLLASATPSNLIFKKLFLLKGLKAHKIRLDYTHQPLTLYQISVADAAQERLFHVSFSCLTAEFEDKQLLFDNILSTLRF